MRFITSNTKVDWAKAVKHGNVFAKPVVSAVVDPKVTRKLLLETLEGEERLGESAVICMGQYDDMWQQTARAFLDKYDIKDITPTGWLLGQAKPGNAVRAIQITNELCSGEYFEYDMEEFPNTGDKSFYITSAWGKEVNGEYRQYGVIGDWVLQSIERPLDNWIVKQKIFANTYSISEATT